ncbi:leucine-rich repeat domain-containing protein [Fredinandcohnia onubensis]|uniref:leucine-rich repeat domain-containing protein n=1 Tax=Fredinandcohnia onubensis TaxID=1571209 RepID=UPI000C0BDB53|nr:leucine-rich repeat domain-containing protein [Fredinandcohnia onubensis]
MDNPISDVSVLKNLPNLDTLYLNNFTGDPSSLGSLTQLEELVLTSSNLTNQDIANVSTLKNLKRLNLSNNNITDISALSGLTQIEELFLIDNQITNVSPLRNMKQLRHLTVHNNAVSNVSPLSNLPKLKSLYLGFNKLSDLSSFENLNQVELLYLESNNISKIDSLLEMDSLSYVDLFNNPLFTSAENVVKALEEKDVYVDVLSEDLGRGGTEQTQEETKPEENKEPTENEEKPEGNTGSKDTTQDDSESQIENNGEPTTVTPQITNGTASVVNSDVEKVQKGATLVVDVSQTESTKVNLSKEQVKTLKEKGASFAIKNNSIELQIPLNNLPDGKEISTDIKKLKPVKNAVSDVYDFTIYADGTAVSQFKEPVTLVFAVDESKIKNSDDLQVYYFNEAKQKWELIPGAKYNNGQVTVTTNHFSIYTVFEVSGSSKTAEKELVAEHPETTQTSSGDKTGLEEVEGKLLPETASPQFNTLIVGTVILLAGVILLFAYRRKSLR